MGYGWNVLRVGDANDVDLIEHALEVFRQTTGRPTLVILDSHIGYGSPNRQDTAAAHGEPLGEEEIKLTKRVYGWPEDAKFLVPDGVREHFAAGIGARGAAARRAWTDLFASYRARHPDLAAEIEQMQKRELPAGWDRNLPVFPADPKGLAGRDASGQVLNVLAQNVPGFSAARRTSGRPTRRRSSTRARATSRPRLRRQEPALRHPRACDGRDRERDVAVEAAAVRRDLLHLQRLCAARDPAVRADGAADDLRLHARRDGRRRRRADAPAGRATRVAPRRSRGSRVLRPGDANEVVEAYRYVMQLRHRPAVLVLSRQPLPTLDRKKYAPASGVARGAYVLADAPGGNPEVILIATGSEVSLAAEAHEKLVADGIHSRVVSMPSWDIFEREPQAYRDSVLPPKLTARVAIEQASTFGWERYVGRPAWSSACRPSARRRH